MENNAAAIRNLKVSDIFDNGYSSIENFTQNTGIPICQRKLTGLRGLYDTASIKYSKDPEAPIDNTPIHTFVNRFTRGSKTFRKVFREKNPEQSQAIWYVLHTIRKQLSVSIYRKF